VPLLFGCAEDRDFGCLLEDFWSDGYLGGGASFAHARVCGTAFGAECFESFLGACSESEFADGDAEAAGVAHAQLSQRWWNTVVGHGDLSAELKGCALPQPLGYERYVQLCGRCGARGAQCASPGYKGYE
jgi:hypothetical protein